MIKKKILFILFYLLFSTSLFANKIIDSIISKNNLYLNKIITFEAELEVSSTFQDQTLLRKARLYLNNKPIKKAKIEFLYPQSSLAPYDTMIHDGKKVIYLKNGEIITGNITNSSGDCITCETNLEQSTLHMTFNDDIINYEVISIKSNNNDYIIIGRAKNNSWMIAKKVFIIDKVIGLLKESIEYDKEERERKRVFFTNKLINNIWICYEAREEIILNNANDKMSSITRFKNIKINEPISDNLFKY